MESSEIKAKVQAAYARAITQSSTSWAREDRFNYLFRDLRLYGRDAGVDFVQTHIAEITRCLVETAETRAASVTMTPHQFGKDAMAGMTQAMRELTGLKVERSGAGVVVTWADNNPRLI